MAEKVDLSREIEAYALQNALEHGMADAGRVLPKLFQHGLEKKDIKDVMPLIQQAIVRINALDAQARAEAFSKLKDVVKVHEEKERVLPELPNHKGKLVFRLAPFPSGALHVGNAKTFLLNALYAEKYKAKLLLVIDDTIGSEEKQPMKEAYDLIIEAAELLGVKYAKPVIYKSDRLKIYYDYAEKLMLKGKAYVCHCPQETLRKNRELGVECGCRLFPKEMQLKRWKEMFKAKEGSAVVRIKTDMQHPNPAFRDRVLFKISDREHPRVGHKYRVWPTLEMSWAVDDHLLKITHILRGNDLMIETDMEKYIWDIFKWKHPETLHTGLIKLEGADVKLSKSKAQKEVKDGTFSGWDDPRTWSIQSLIRRGITKEALRLFVEEIGLNKQDITVPIDALYAANRRVIDALVPRYYFISEPIELAIVDQLTAREVTIPVHPDTPDQTRTIPLTKVLVSQQDLETNLNKEIRLLHLCNVMLGEKISVTGTENKKIPKVQWVADHVRARIRMPDGSWKEGVAESSVQALQPGEVLQFERFGFVRFDQVKDDTYEFWFAHA